MYSSQYRLEFCTVCGARYAQHVKPRLDRPARDRKARDRARLAAALEGTARGGKLRSARHKRVTRNKHYQLAISSVAAQVSLSRCLASRGWGASPFPFSQLLGLGLDGLLYCSNCIRFQVLWIVQSYRLWGEDSPKKYLRIPRKLRMWPPRRIALGVALAAGLHFCGANLFLAPECLDQTPKCLDRAPKKSK